MQFRKSKYDIEKETRINKALDGVIVDYIIDKEAIDDKEIKYFKSEFGDSLKIERRPEHYVFSVDKERSKDFEQKCEAQDIKANKIDVDWINRMQVGLNVK